MDIVAFIKRVPDNLEAEVIKIEASGRTIEKAGVPFKINNWDEYVLETAAQLKEKQGGTFTAVTVGQKDWDDVLRRALAMGADKAIRLDEDVFNCEPSVVATIIKTFLKTLSFDLVLFGAQSEDFGSGQLGVMVAEMLGIPHAALVVSLEINGQRVRVNRELEGGTLESYDITLPALLTIQTGINQPRYVSVAGIRRAMRMDIQIMTLNDFGLEMKEISSKVNLQRLEMPTRNKQAEMLSGSPGESTEKLLKILKDSGVL